MKDLSAIRCLLLPVGRYNLLLPSATIAEIVPNQTPEYFPEHFMDIPPPLVGMIVWRGRKIPLFIFDPTIGTTLAPLIKPQIVVLRTPIEINSQPFIGLQIYDIPHLISVKPADLVRALPPEPVDFQLMTAFLADQLVIVPDITTLVTDYWIKRIPSEEDEW